MKRDSATKSPTSSQQNEAKKSKGNTSSENKNGKATNEATILINPIDVATILAKDDKFVIPTLKRDAAAIKNSIFEEGFLCPRKFQQMEEFEHAKYKRSYIHKYYDMYFEHTYKLHTEIDKVFIRGKGQGIIFDTKTVVEYIKQLKDIAERVGALKVLNEIDKMLQSCKEGDLEGFISAFDNGWEETIKLPKKVDPYLELMCRIQLREELAKVVQRAEEHEVEEWEWKKILNSSIIASSSSSEEGSFI